MVDPIRPSEFQTRYTPIRTADIGSTLHASGVDLSADQIKSLQSVDTDRDGVIGNSANETANLYQKIYSLGLSSDDAARTARALCKPDPNGSVQIGARTANDNILMLGLNPGAGSEARALRQGRGSVTLIKSAAEGQDQITARGTDGKDHVYDLRDTDPKSQYGLHAFVQTLDLPPDQSQQIEGIINGVGSRGKDEMAELARQWSVAERGGTIASRLVLSGHSGGITLFGDGNGSISYDQIGKLAAAMPRAAAQIEDVGIAACYAGGADNADKFKSMFPNMRTFMGYTDSAPASGSGSEGQLQSWERQTRGRADTIRRPGVNSAVWSNKTGYNDGKPAVSTADLKSTYQSGDATYQRFFKGDEVVRDPHSGNLRSNYNDTQHYSQRLNLEARTQGSSESSAHKTERATIDARRQQTMRLLYFTDSIRGRFASEYSTQLRAGYADLGLNTPPDISHMSRKDAVAEVARFNAAFAKKYPDASKASSDAQEARRLMNDGLLNLDPTVIPDTWI